LSDKPTGDAVRDDLARHMSGDLNALVY
jgi:hypothetical protein